MNSKHSSAAPSVPEPVNDGASFHEANHSISPSCDSQVCWESVLRIRNEMIRVSDTKLDHSPRYELGDS